MFFHPDYVRLLRCKISDFAAKIPLKFNVILVISFEMQCFVQLTCLFKDVFYVYVSKLLKSDQLHLCN